MTDETIPPLERLVAIEAIKQLKARYFRFVDRHQWPELRALFTDDAHYDVEGGSGHHVWDSPDPFLEHLERRMSGAVSVHHGHMPEIEIRSADRATGVWAMFDFVEVPPNAPYHGYGHYEETYRRVDGDWRISSLKLTRLRVDVLPPSGERLY